MNRRITLILCVFLLITALGITLYPLISNIVGETYRSLVETQYEQAVAKLDDVELSTARKAAENYNRTLLTIPQEAYTRDALLQAEQSYNDLLNPALKGKIASGDPTKSSSAWAELTNMLLVMGDEPYDEKAWEFVEKFVEQLDGIQLDSSSAIYKGVADGEYVVGVSYEDPCINMLASGADVYVVYPEEGAVWLPAATAIVKGAPHEAAAQAFIDFQLSNEGQSIYANLTTRAVNSTLPLGNEFMKPFSEINVVYEDIPYCAEHKTEWQARYAEIRDKR